MQKELIEDSRFQVWIDGIPQTIRIRNPEFVSRKKKSTEVGQSAPPIKFTD